MLKKYNFPYPTAIPANIWGVRGFTKKLNDLTNLSYAKRLEIIGLDSIQTRRIKSDLVLCYSIVYGYSCMKLADFFVLRNTSIRPTRGHNFKLYKPLFIAL